MDQGKGGRAADAAGTPRVALAPPAWIFALLVLPSAIYRHGVAFTALGSLLRTDGMKVDDIANVVALFSLPQMLYFVWSPLVDFWIKRRTWVAGTSVVAGTLLGIAMQARHLGTFWPEALLLVGMCVVMLSVAALGGLMAEVVPADRRTRASGFSQCGNLGFGALAGGGVLYLSQHMGRREFGIVCGLLVAAPGLLSLMVAETGAVGDGEGLRTAVRRIGQEFRTTFFKWEALPVLLILMAPLGSGAAIGLLPGLAPDYGVSVGQVAWMNGLGGGLLTAFGALLIGFIKLPTDMRMAYATGGLVNALSLGFLVVGRPSPVGYFVGVSIYMVSVGAVYGLVIALALKLLGLAGKSGGSRYAIVLSFANFPVWYMTVVDGLGARWFGVKGVPGIDMVVSGVSAIAFIGWFWWERRRGIEVDLGLVSTPDSMVL